MLNERIGGTEEDVANREEARRMVPSPPNVAIRSTLDDSLDEMVCLVEEGSV